MADNLAFMGAEGANARLVANRLLGGREDLRSRFALTPGVEIRSAAAAGALTLGSDWNLLAAGSATAPMTLTLRAAADLVLSHSLSDGFAAAPGTVDARSITAFGLARAGKAASYRLVGGADLASADPMATVDTVGALDGGDVIIGREAARPSAPLPGVFIRTTTGNIEIAAGHDVQQLNSQARIYTTGTPVGLDVLPQFDAIRFGNGQLMRGAAGVLGPFFDGAGDIDVRAGNDLLGSPGTSYTPVGTLQGTQFVTDWWWRQAAVGVEGKPVALWARYDLFGQGVASFGGGDIRVDAGRDIRDLEVSTPTTGYAIGARAESALAPAAPAAARWFEGGTLAVQAGRDVVSGLYNAGGPVASLTAGGAIRAADSVGLGQSHPATQLFYMDTAWTVQAGGALNVATPLSTTKVSGVRQALDSALGRPEVITGLDTAASARIVSTAGDVTLLNLRPQLGAGDSRGTDTASQVVPDDLLVAAPGGALTVPTLLQRPVGAAGLSLLAQGPVAVTELQVNAASAAAATEGVSRVSYSEAFDPYNGEWTHNADGGADTSDRSPVRIVSATGGVSVEGKLVTARPLRVVAETDIALNGDTRIQHQAGREDGLPRGSELSLLAAGRDIHLASTGALRLAGPGDLLMAAGRDVDFGRGPGVVTVGSLDNSRVLEAGGANVTLMAGVQLDAADFTAALAKGFHLRGGERFDEHADALSVWFAAGATVPDLTSAAARAAAARFRALDADTQLARARQAAGEAAYRAAVVAQMRSRPGQAGMSNSAAVAAFEALASADRAPLLAGLTQGLYAGLAAGWSEAQRASVAQAIVQARLIDFVERHSGASGLSAAQATKRLEALPVERQALLLNEVLFAELRAAGRAASALAGKEREAAYRKGYDAIATLFPGSRTVGAVNLSNSQVKTQQGGDVRILTPGGGVNVGELAAGGVVREASELGIVTVAGGRVEAMVRDDFDVNQSRVFSLRKGDVLLWSSEGNLDAGRGAKTVTGSPPPLVTINDKGDIVIDTSGSFSGSGIAVLDASSSLDLYAPKGEINAGDAGIRSMGNAYFGAVRFVGADNLAVGGASVGAPPPAPTGGDTAGLANTGASATQANSAGADDKDDDDKRKRRSRRNLLLDFLGFGSDK